MSDERIFRVLERIEDKVDGHTVILAKLEADHHSPMDCKGLKELKDDLAGYIATEVAEKAQVAADKRAAGYKTAMKECARLIGAGLTALGVTLGTK